MDIFVSIMSTPWLLTSAAVVLGVLYWLTKHFRTGKGTPPPGPRGWNGFKEVLRASFNDDLYLAAWKWAEKFGDMTFYTLFGQPVCILNSTDIVRRLFASDEYKLLTSDRTPNVVSELAWFNGKDIFFTPYDNITRRKRILFHKALGVYGEGVPRFENVVGRELDRVLEELKAADIGGQDVPMHHILARSLKIILFILVNGEIDTKKISYDAVDILERYDNAVNQMLDVQNLTALTFLPIVRKFGKFKKVCDEVVESKTEAEKLLFDDTKATYEPGKARGVADVLRDFQRQPGYEWFDDEHVKGFLIVAFFAAHMTSRSSLLNIILTLVHNPEIARRIQGEIETVVGDRKPRVDDRKDMHYTEAVIIENLRFVSQVTLASARTAGNDIHIDGYVIPKGTQIFANQWFFHRDPSIWEDPWAFKPERFLDDKGMVLPANHPVRKKVQAFGIGNRMCPGESFARSRIFLFVATILQKYDLLPPENEPLPSCDPRNNVKGIIRQAPPYKCRLRARKGTS